MKLGRCVLVVVFSAGSAALGQSPAKSEPFHPAPQVNVLDAGTPKFILLPAPAQACPVSLEARQRGLTDMVRVRSGEQENDRAEKFRPTGRIRLLLGRDTGGRKIVSVTVTARGFSARGRIDRSANPGGADLRRTFTTTVGEADDGLYADLTLPGFTAVQSIKLESLNYGDGARLELSGSHFCTVAPDGVMLVAAADR